jgi:exopolyphosphatase/guanosine-5'-triphosphate,3'-diphosphate pyrophosphatase
MRSACIDIGSNTTRLLVAELDGDRLREVVTQRVFTNLRCFDGSIPGAKVAELAGTVAAQTALAHEVGAEHVEAVATAAVRGADNRDELCAAVQAAAGVPVNVLSGEDEARLAFIGATRTLPVAPEGRVAVVDVGGGSTELVAGTAAGGVTWSVSLPLGSGLVTRADLPTDPPSAAELTSLRGKLERAFAEVQAPRPAAAYAVGGSATSLQRLVGNVLEREALARGLQALVTRPAVEVALRLGLHPERARLLPAAILLLDAASRALRAPLQLAGGGLREGVVLEQLAHLRAEPA